MVPVRDVEGIFILDDIVGFVNEEHYMEFCHPYLKRICDAFPSDWVKIYHNDAEVEACLDHLPDVGFNVLNWGKQTTTMTYMKTVIDGFDAPGRDHIKMAIGGAPISQMFADEIGADGYGADASSAVDLFLYLVGKGPAPGVTAKRGVALAPEAPAPAGKRDPNARSKYQVLYWQDIPSQLKAWDDCDEAKLDLPHRFADRIDAQAQRLGLAKGDDYISQLRGGDELERVGAPAEVAAAVRKELEDATP